jgi:hypothetical protein
VRALKRSQQLEPYLSDDNPYDVMLQEQVSNTGITTQGWSPSPPATWSKFMSARITRLGWSVLQRGLIGSNECKHMMRCTHTVAHLTATSKGSFPWWAQPQSSIVTQCIALQIENVSGILSCAGCGVAVSWQTAALQSVPSSVVWVVLCSIGISATYSAYTTTTLVCTCYTAPSNSSATPVTHCMMPHPAVQVGDDSFHLHIMPQPPPSDAPSSRPGRSRAASGRVTAAGALEAECVSGVS